MIINNIKGIENEIMFVKEINNKKICDMSFQIQNFINDLFGHIDSNTIMHCWKNDLNYKTDIYIRPVYSNYSMKISIKKGVSNSVHVEPLSTFTDFLRENNIPTEIIYKYLMYHFGDETINGTGKARNSAIDYKAKHQNEIDEINLCLNKNIIFLKNAINRFLINGKNSNEYIDAIIYGTIDDFVWLKRNDLYYIFFKHMFDYSSGPHCSFFNIQPEDRNLKYNKEYDNKRFCVQIKWFNIYDYIIEYMNDEVVLSLQADYVGQTTKKQTT